MGKVEDEIIERYTEAVSQNIKKRFENIPRLRKEKIVEKSKFVLKRGDIDEE